MVDAFRRAFFAQHDAKAAAQVYAADATLWDPSTPGVIRGRQAMEENLAAYLRALPDISVETTNLFGSGDCFAAEFTMRGTNTGPFDMGPGNPIPPTGKRVELKLCWIGRVTPGGLCAEDRTYYDSATLMQQLGLAGQ